MIMARIRPELQVDIPDNLPPTDMSSFYHNSFEILTAFAGLRGLAKCIRGIEYVISKET